MPSPLRSVWNEPRPDPPPRRWLDWLLVGAVVVAVVLEGIFRSDLDFRVVSVVLGVGLAPTLLWRRSRPLPMLTIAFVLSALQPLLTHGQPTDLHTLVYLLLLPFALVRWGSGRDIVLGSAVILGTIGIEVLVGTTSVGDGVGGLALLVAFLAVAAALRYRARARVREITQAKLLERERLARDLHDTVAHHVSAMAIRAQAGLAMAGAQPEAATEALRVIEAEATRALAEMRAMVRVLRRDEGAELTPSPRIADIAALSQARTGPMVYVRIDGDVDDVPESVGTTIYRLAQESVTNARRHARHATRIEVSVAADDTSVRLRVSDDGEAHVSGTGGYGLIGMAERAGLLGGTCEAGPGPDRGWTVTAVLPRTGSTR
ncbi:MAG TPA: histidine kinase [Pseudonocardiaceae bacterium]|nr:histidine kinase [Pseudonocardiaceae bacterium]